MLQRIISDKGWRMAGRVAAWSVFALALITYLLTIEPTASFWDCPEYVAVASRLEVGHPPGNPTWMLAAHIASLFVPDSQHIALAVNITSALFTALAALLLALTVGMMADKLAGRRRGGRTVGDALGMVVAQVAGGLAFAWCDTAWFSAVEAEVYAFSIFCTALTIWIALKWGAECRTPHADRWLVLLAYVTGLSIGVHQLNLLCIPAVALILLFSVNRSRRIAPLFVCLILGASMIAIACILFGMMPGMIALASEVELFAVNTLGMPFNSGTVAYIVVAFVIAVSAAVIVTESHRAWLRAIAVAMICFISGIFAFGGKIWLGAILSALTTGILFINTARMRRAATILVWSVGFLMLGYSTYSVIIIRAAANPPMNQGNPSNIFAFASYLGRDQYGSRPLLHGRTPKSFMLKQEQLRRDAEGDTTADYSAYARIKRSPKYFPAITGAPIVDKSGFMTAKDSLFNQRQYSSSGPAYVIAGYNYEYEYPPELDMWFPRIVSGDADHLAAYSDWIGMTDSTMTDVEASVAVDSAGNPVGTFVPGKAKREKRHAVRPTYLQNLQALATYQVAYMYLRYLLWNFSGRQNFIPSQGQVDSGNFITGFDLIDEAMLGDNSLMPREAGKQSRGHNVYFMLPLLLALLGMAFQLRRGMAGERQFAIIGWLFIMTGVAIVIYLNQTPGEPRERDYSFVGSFYAFAIWIGFGAQALVSAAMRRLAPRLSNDRARDAVISLAAIFALAVPALMVAQNYDDHDRSGRTLTSDYAFDTLHSLDPDAIIFVNGDNFTFPLWYSQDVEGVRRDVRVINLAYLNTEWLPASLRTQAFEGKPVAMTARAADLAYGRMQSVFIPADNTPVDAITALRYLYKQKSATPRFPSSRIRIPRRDGNDSIIIDLKAVSAGKGSLSQQNLLMLDIIATNAANGWKRPIYWSVALPDSHKASLARYNSYAGLALRLTDSIADHAVHNPAQISSLLLSKFRYGNIDRPGRWTDEPGDGQVRMLRRALRIYASEALDNNKPQTALNLLRRQLQALPPQASEYSIYADRYLMVDEAVETALLLSRCADALNMPSLKAEARQLLLYEARRTSQWYAYYRALPPNLRATTSPFVRAAVTNFYAPIDAYLKCGGSIDDIKKIPQLKGVNLNKEREAWMRYSHLRSILRDARYPVDDSTTKAHLDLYFSAGGTREALDKYTELNGFPFEKYGY